MKTIALLLLLLSFAPCAYGWQHDLEVRAELYDDSDSTNNATLDQVFHWKDQTTKIGVGATQTLITESGGARGYAGGLLEGYKKIDQVDFSGQLKMLYWDRQLKTPASLASTQTLGDFHLEESVDYGTVDSVKAYQYKIDFWGVGGAVDWNVLKQLTITGGYWHFWFSDNNRRDKAVARASYSLTDNFLLQYRYKGIWNDKQVPQYFSPEVFNQHALLFGYADSFWDSVRVKLMAGPVWQDDGFQKSTGALEDVRVTWRFLELWSLTAHLEADQVGSGYQYLYSTLALTRDF